MNWDNGVKQGKGKWPGHKQILSNSINIHYHWILNHRKKRLILTSWEVNCLMFSKLSEVPSPSLLHRLS